ncbi:MAG: hypothetical protein ACKOEA_05755 [Candidatus Nanopelagicus sp.]|jgi:hypothetical protein
MLSFKRLIIIMLLPALLSSCARAQGALAPTGVPPASEGFAPIDQSDRSYLPDVEPAALEPIINYVDGLNLALTGEFLYLRSTAISSCDCLAIADRLAKLFKSATLVGGSYQLKRVDLAKDGVNQKSFAVVIDRSDIRKIDKSSRQSILWSASTIKNTFTVKRIGKEWLLSDIK